MRETREQRIARKMPDWIERRATLDAMENQLGTRPKVQTYDEREEAKFQRERLQAVRSMFERDMLERSVHLVVETDEHGNGFAILLRPDGKVTRAKVNRFTGAMWK